MLYEDLEKIENGRCITKDGGVGSGIKGHITVEQMKAMKGRGSAKQMAAIKEKLGLRKVDPKKAKWAGGIVHKGEENVNNFLSEHPFVKSLTPKFKEEMKNKGFKVVYKGDDVEIETPSTIYFSEREDK